MSRFREGQYVSVLVDDKRVGGIVTKANERTVIVRIQGGNVIKRHIVKHAVKSEER